MLKRVPKPKGEGQSLADKVAHVKSAKQDRDHECHWPGCKKQCKPAYWGCFHHWMMLPSYLRKKVWDAYRIGQEKTMSPSREYLAVAREVERWIKENYPDG